MQNDKLFSEQEVKKILSLAMNQENKKDSVKNDSGLSIEEIIQIGKETGIDEDKLRDAAKRVRYSTSEDSNKVVSDTSDISTERWITGKLEPRQIENFFAELKQRLNLKSGWWDSSNELKRLGDSYEYSFYDSRVTLTEKESGYFVHVQKAQFFDGTALEATILGIPLSFIFGIIPAAAVNDLFGVYWAVLIMVIAYALSFNYVKRYTRKKRKEVRDHLKLIANESEEIIEEYINKGSGVDGNKRQQLDFRDEINIPQNQKEQNPSEVSRRIRTDL